MQVIGSPLVSRARPSDRNLIIPSWCAACGALLGMSMSMEAISSKRKLVPITLATIGWLAAGFHTYSATKPVPRPPVPVYVAKELPSA